MVFCRFPVVLSGFLDRLVGGVGLRRGRRHPRELHMGDSLDFFRVLDVEPPRRLQLLAEMRFPGEATLEFRVHGLEGDAQSFSSSPDMCREACLGWFTGTCSIPFTNLSSRVC